jgi:hypothetical protein
MVKSQNKINSKNESKQNKIAIKRMWTKFKRKKKIKRGEIEKAHQFYGSFKIKNIVIKRKWTKSEEPTN